MRKSDARKWLHAALDLLPVILIPVFMIYSHRHTIDGSSLEITEDLIVPFSQLGNPYDNEQYGLTITYEDASNTYSVVGTASANNGPFITRLADQNDRRLGWYAIPNHKYYVRSNYSLDDGVRIQNTLNGQYQTPSVNTIWTSVFTTNSLCNVWFRGVTDQVYNITDLEVNVFDLTQIFGVGNEPSIEVFNTYFNQVYPYMMDVNVVLEDYIDITYNDTDIMSQFTYQMYNAVDKYFNMGNIFNLNGVYDWFNVNIFHGNAPIYIYIVWQIVLYEFVMDLLFLLYGLFMFFIDSCTNLMERFSCQLRGR